MRINFKLWIFGSACFLLLVTSGCENVTADRVENDIDETIEVVEESADDFIYVESPKLDDVVKLYNDTGIYRFNSDELTWLSFDAKTVFFEFGDQCLYSFPLMHKDGQLQVVWNPTEDCLFDVGMDQDFSVKKVPKKGLVFAQIKVKDSVTVTVDYFYSEWVEEFNSYNEHLTNKLFVNKFRLVNY